MVNMGYDCNISDILHDFSALGAYLDCKISKNPLNFTIFAIMIFNRQGKLYELETPAVMGVINVTPDSFYSQSRCMQTDGIVKRAGEMLRDGADILDIGACSTRPGSDSVSASEELMRLVPALDAIRRAFPDALLSVDTFRSEIAREAAERWKVDIINDVSGGDDPEMFDVVSDMDLVYVLMHKRGTPSSMQSLCEYADVTAEVISELAFRLDLLRAKGVKDVIIDPGFGFAKNLDQNFRLMDELEEFKKIGPPLLIGISRKSMITNLLGSGADEALPATIALETVAMMKGADIIRVHDVKPAAHAAAVIKKLRQCHI